MTPPFTRSKLAVLAVLLLHMWGLAAAEPASSITLTASGIAGEWILSYTELGSANCSEIDVVLRVTSDSPAPAPVAVFIGGPAAVDADFPHISGNATILWDDSGQMDITLHYRRLDIPHCDGVGFAFASNGNWTVHAEARPSSIGSGVASSFLTEGGGASFARGEPGRVSPGFSRSIVEIETAGGWTHLQFDSLDAVATRPVDARAYDVAFPNELKFSSREVSPGISASAVVPYPGAPPGCCEAAHRVNYWQTLGEQLHEGGRVTASVVSSEDSRVMVTAANIPLRADDWPPEFVQVRYWSM